MPPTVKKKRRVRTRSRFADRDRRELAGSVVDYKEVEVLRKLMTASNRIMSRKRAGTSAQEQRDIKLAIKHARFMAMLPYTGM